MQVSPHSTRTQSEPHIVMSNALVGACTRQPIVSLRTAQPITEGRKHHCRCFSFRHRKRHAVCLVDAEPLEVVPGISAYLEVATHWGKTEHDAQKICHPSHPCQAVSTLDCMTVDGEHFPTRRKIRLDASGLQYILFNSWPSREDQIQ